ncbi:retrovirus-related pol polyprotein from transposon TNT 1-94 [Tanacetum coccineum]
MDNRWQQPITHEITVLVKNLLIPLAIKIKAHANEFERDLKREMFEDLEYVQSLEKEVDKLESKKAEFSNKYDLLLQECLSKDIIELKKLIEKLKGKDVDTNYEKPSVVRQPNAFKSQKPYVLGKPSPFSNSPFSKSKFSPTTNVNQNLSKPVTPQILPQNGKQVTSRNTNPHVSTSTGVIHRTNVSRPQLRSTQLKEKVVQNNSQVKIKQKEVEDHHMISSFFNKTMSVTACNDSLKSTTSNVNAIVQNILFIVDSGCTKHMTRNLKLLCNFVERYLGTVRFENDQFAPILGYGDLVQGNVTIKRVYYVEGLNHNLFLGNDLLMGTHRSDLYSISLQETSSPTPICFMVNASPTQAWLWHRRLSHLNFDTINLLSKKDIVNGLPKLKYIKDQLCPSCEMGKGKKKLILNKDCSKF